MGNKTGTYRKPVWHATCRYVATPRGDLAAFSLLSYFEKTGPALHRTPGEEVSGVALSVLLRGNRRSVVSHDRSPPPFFGAQSQRKKKSRKLEQGWAGGAVRDLSAQRMLQTRII